MIILVKSGNFKKDSVFLYPLFLYTLINTFWILGNFLASISILIVYIKLDQQLFKSSCVKRCNFPFDFLHKHLSKIYAIIKHNSSYVRTYFYRNSWSGRKNFTKNIEFAFWHMVVVVDLGSFPFQNNGSNIRENSRCTENLKNNELISLRKYMSLTHITEGFFKQLFA